MICDPKQRFSALEVLNHPWVKNKSLISEDAILNLHPDSLKCFQSQNNIQKAVLTFIASRLKDDEIRNLTEIFNALDKNKDGTITLDEIKEGKELI